MNAPIGRICPFYVFIKRGPLRPLKGGSNLRFFFRSVRYSEDIDFDVIVVAKGTLKKKVDRLLRSPTVIAPLRHEIFASRDAWNASQDAVVSRLEALR
jgi:hypothetical protein